ncbi:hypothetical protein GGR57DRAFT_395337 [Xylariaceae sp. FL1272]|nr:hypothetical protein GGR57DRAFT_395337 [Xylariaceae sp. FL1272]
MEVADAPGLESAAAESSEIQARQELDHTLQPTITSDGERGTKRSAEEDPEDPSNAQNGAPNPTDEPKLSKNKMRKLKRQKMREEQRADRTFKRKEKRHERKERKRALREEEKTVAAAEGREPNLDGLIKKQKPQNSVKVPIAIVIDCQFEKYMFDNEQVSLANQVTRCYSDNRTAKHPVNLYVSSYGGLLKERYENVMRSQHANWKNFTFETDDFVETAKKAKEWMESGKAGQKIALLQQEEGDSVTMTGSSISNPKKLKNAPKPEAEAEDVDKSIIYLTADSPYTLDRLEPNTSYVIGGIIDRNREKGLCYKVAREKNVRTAKLPIGEFMVLHSRHVLATNHVVEIMLKWLETGDWGKAFLEVIPTRKGGKLKGDDDEEESVAVDDGEEADYIEDLKKSEEAPGDDGEETMQVDGDNAEEGLETNALDRREFSAPPQEAEQVDGDNAEDGMKTNALDRREFSAPPPEAEKIDEVPASDAALS